MAANQKQPKKHRRGRPKVRVDLRRDQNIHIRVTAAEKSIVLKNAQKCDDMDLSDFARQMLLTDPDATPKKPSKLSEAKQLRRDAINGLSELGNHLSWIGNNLNQVAMILNATGDPYHKKAQDLPIYLNDISQIKETIENAICDIAGYRRDR